MARQTRLRIRREAPRVLTMGQGGPLQPPTTASKRLIAMSDATTMRTAMRASPSSRFGPFCSTAVQAVAIMINPPARSVAAPMNNAISNGVMTQLLRIAASVVEWDKDRAAQAHLLGVTRAADDPLGPQGAPRERGGCLDHRSRGSLVIAFHCFVIFGHRFGACETNYGRGRDYSSGPVRRTRLLSDQTSIALPSSSCWSVASSTCVGTTHSLTEGAGDLGRSCMAMNS